MEIEIVPMTFDDLDAVQEIERAVFTQPWTRGMFAAELSKTNLSTYFVAKVKGEIIGYTGLFSVFEEGHITTLAVKPEYQGQGVGTMLILNLLESSLSKGVKRFTLEVRKSNLSARRLYEKFGFQEMGVRKRYYRDNDEDAIVFCTGDLSSQEYQKRLESIKNDFREKCRINQSRK